MIARKNLEAFWLRHPETEQPLRAWLTAAKTRNWTSMNDVLRTFFEGKPYHGGAMRLRYLWQRKRQLPSDRRIQVFRARSHSSSSSVHTRYDRVVAATVSEF